MNSVNLAGFVSQDPRIHYSETGEATVAHFSVAINRGKDKNGEDRGADFPNCTAFGKTASIIDRYVHKGSRIGITGRIHTDSYEKDGRRIFTTDIVVDRLELLDRREDKPAADDVPASMPTGFSQLTDQDIPF